MPRTVQEWVGRTDDTPPSKACKRRILERQGYVCALTGLPFDDKHKPRFDHRIPLWLGGENRESNLQALRDDEAHKPKTKSEAKVRAKVHANIDIRFGLDAKAGKLRGRPFPPGAKAKHDRIWLQPRSLYSSRPGWIAVQTATTEERDSE